MLTYDIVMPKKISRGNSHIFLEEKIPHKNIDHEQKNDIIHASPDVRDMADPRVRGKSGLHGTAHRLIYRAGRPDD